MSLAFERIRHRRRSTYRVHHQRRPAVHRHQADPYPGEQGDRSAQDARVAAHHSRAQYTSWVVATYRSDEHYRGHERDAVWPASWHRAVVARVAERVPGLVILYRD